MRPSTARIKRTCACGTITEAASGICRACRGHAAYINDESPEVLTGGRWVPGRHGIMRWVEGVVTPAPPPVKPKLHSSRTLVACPACGADADTTCKTRSGNPTTPHKARLVSRRCKCGSTLEPKKRYCEPCRVMAREETYRNREIAKRQRSATTCEDCQAPIVRTTRGGPMPKRCEPCARAHTKKRRQENRRRLRAEGKKAA